MKALQIAATGMAAQQMKVDVVSNNLANMSTTGYNPRRADFADLMYQQVQKPGTISSESGTMLPTGRSSSRGWSPVTTAVASAGINAPRPLPSPLRRATADLLGNTPIRRGAS